MDFVGQKKCTSMSSHNFDTIHRLFGIIAILHLLQRKKVTTAATYFLYLIITEKGYERLGELFRESHRCPRT